MKTRLDQEIVHRGLAETRSQAENLIRLSEVEVDGWVISADTATDTYGER